VLVGLCDCPVKNGPNCKRNNTDDKSSSTDHADPFQLVAMAVPVTVATKRPNTHGEPRKTTNHVIDGDARTRVRVYNVHTREFERFRECPLRQ
jgi:hypothetical protein